ncbi:hypothetical protein LQZ19_11470 [Treponema primitia]|uniref:hypothetical protein n=1 Tax=Treponema primitia TaxID=88058 RepID=UPI003980A45D
MEKAITEKAEYELIEIAAELTALGDMIPLLILNYEDIEANTPQGVKILHQEIRKRLDGVRKQIEGYSGKCNTGKEGQSLGGTSV